MSLDQFKSTVEDFLSKTGMTPTAFGKRFAGDPLFVFQIRDGREPREATPRSRCGRAALSVEIAAHVDDEVDGA